MGKSIIKKDQVINDSLNAGLIGAIKKECTQQIIELYRLFRSVNDVAIVTGFGADEIVEQLNLHKTEI